MKATSKPPTVTSAAGVGGGRGKPNAPSAPPPAAGAGPKTHQTGGVGIGGNVVGTKGKAAADSKVGGFPWIEEVFAAWIKDNREESNAYNYSKFHGQVTGSCTPDFIKLKRCKLGEMCAVALGRVLKDLEITRIDLSRNILRDLGAMAILKLVQTNPRILHVALATNDLSFESAIGFARELRDSNRLISLDLSNDIKTDSLRGNTFRSLAGVAFGQALMFNTSLVSLNLSRVGLGLPEEKERGGKDQHGTGGTGQEASLAFGEMLKTNSTLKTFKLAGNSFGSLGTVVILQSLASNNALTHLDLSHNNCGADSALVMHTILSANRSLLHLSLASNPLSPAGVIALAEGLKTNMALTSLDLSNVKMMDLGAQSLAAALSENGALKVLDVSNNALTGVSAEAWELCLARARKLEAVCFKNNPLGDTTVQHIAGGAARSRSITSLDLTCVKAEDGAALSLATVASTSSTLVSLKLADNFISDEAGKEMIFMLESGQPVFEIDLTANQLSHTSLLRLERVCAKHREDSKSREPRILLVEIKRLRQAEKRLRETEFQLSRTRTARIELDKSRAGESELLEGMKQRGVMERGRFENELKVAKGKRDAAIAALQAKEKELKEHEVHATKVSAKMEATIEEETQRRQRLQEEAEEAERKFVALKESAAQELDQIQEEIENVKNEIMEVQESVSEELAELRILENRSQQRENEKRKQEAEAKRLAEEAELERERKLAAKGKKGKKGGKKGKKK